MENCSSMGLEFQLCQRSMFRRPAVHVVPIVKDHGEPLSVQGHAPPHEPGGRIRGVGRIHDPCISPAQWWASLWFPWLWCCFSRTTFRGTWSRHCSHLPNVPHPIPGPHGSGSQGANRRQVPSGQRIWAFAFKTVTPGAGP